MKFDYSTLLLLRKNARLDPISFFKVVDEREAAVDYWRIMKRMENCDIGIDYSRAEQLEANLRFKAWQKKVCGYYLDYKGNLSLEEFAMGLLKEKENKRVLKKRKA